MHFSPLKVIPNTCRMNKNPSFKIITAKFQPPLCPSTSTKSTHAPTHLSNKLSEDNCAIWGRWEVCYAENLWKSFGLWPDAIWWTEHATKPPERPQVFIFPFWNTPEGIYFSQSLLLVYSYQHLHSNMRKKIDFLKSQNEKTPLIQKYILELCICNTLRMTFHFVFANVLQSYMKI